MSENEQITKEEALDSAAVTDKKEKAKKSVGKEILSWVLTIIGAVVLAVVIRTFLFEPVKVDGRSMCNTLQDGEIMFVSKLEYTTAWLNLPWQDNEAKENCTKIIIGGSPNRGDVVICRYPGRGDTNFVKRIVGLPGDRICVKNRTLYVNGEVSQVENSATPINYSYPELYQRTGTDAQTQFFTRINGEMVSVPDEAVCFTAGGQEITAETRYVISDDSIEYIVPEGYYFALGDNRGNSNDSHSVGPLARDMIIGHVRLVLFPFNAWRGVE